MLAQFSKARSTLTPDVPTAHEQGVEFDIASLRGLAAPKGLPADARERLVKAVARVVADPEFQQRSMQLYTPLRYLSPAEFETALRDGDAQLRQLWKESPWTEK